MAHLPNNRHDDQNGQNGHTKQGATGDAVHGDLRSA